MAVVFAAGIGISVFHPADYAILAAQVGTEPPGPRLRHPYLRRLCRWVVAPPLMLALASALGWAAAVSVAGLIGLLFTAVAALHREALDDAAIRAEPRERTERAVADLRSTARFLASPPVLLFLLFFTALAIGSSGIHAFAVVALVELYDASLTAANAQLTGYFAAAAVGVLIGGVIADRVKDQEGSRRSASSPRPPFSESSRSRCCRSPTSSSRCSAAPSPSG